MMHSKTIVKNPVLQPPFLQPRKWTDKATWQRLGHGLIALCDATDAHMIALVPRLQIISTLYLPEFPSASLSSVDVASPLPLRSLLNERH